MIPRITVIPDNHSFFLFGPRQCGKTTRIESQFGARFFKIDLLQHDTYLHYLKNPGAFRQDVLAASAKHPGPLFVDEIQRIPELLNEIHSLIESHKLIFMMTGSSSRKLKRGGANLLAGRAWQYFLYPYVFREVSRDFNLETALRFGTLPAIYELSDDLKVKALRSYTDTYLREEIQAEGIARNLGDFGRFLEVAAAQSGEVLNYSNLGRECGVDPKICRSYYQILEDTLMGFILYPWRKSVRKQLALQPKFYFFDTGVVNSINRRLTEAPDPTYRGHLFEHLIVLETYRHLHYQDTDCQIFFWRTKYKTEVDLIVEKHGEIRFAIEIKSSKQVTSQHLTALYSIKGDHPGAQCILVCDTLHPYQQDHIEVWPWKDYLEKLPDLLR